MPNFFTASIVARTSSDIKRFFAFDFPLANEAKYHLMLKLLSPGTFIDFLKFPILFLFLQCLALRVN